MIKMIVETMKDEDWDDAKKNYMALMCMVGLGAGEIVGSIIFGRVQDSCSMTVTLACGLLFHVIGITTLIIYTIRFSFNVYLCVAVTFTWGMQDASGIIYMNCICGF